MSLTSDAVKRAHATLPSVLMEGTVLDPPVTAGGYLRIELDSHKGHVAECAWTDQLATPDPGATVAVEESDFGNYWVTGIFAGPSE